MSSRYSDSLSRVLWRGSDDFVGYKSTPYIQVAEGQVLTIDLVNMPSDKIQLDGNAGKGILAAALMREFEDVGGTVIGEGPIMVAKAGYSIGMGCPVCLTVCVPRVYVATVGKYFLRFNSTDPAAVQDVVVLVSDQSIANRHNERVGGFIV